MVRYHAVPAHSPSRLEEVPKVQGGPEQPSYGGSHAVLTEISLKLDPSIFYSHRYGQKTTCVVKKTHENPVEKASAVFLGICTTDIKRKLPSGEPSEIIFYFF